MNCEIASGPSAPRNDSLESVALQDIQYVQKLHAVITM